MVLRGKLYSESWMIHCHSFSYLFSAGSFVYPYYQETPYLTLIWPTERQFLFPNSPTSIVKTFSQPSQIYPTGVFCFSLKKKIENHHPEKEYFIHASLSSDRKIFSTQNGMKKKKKEKRSAWISKSIWKIGKRFKNAKKQPVIPAGVKLPSYYMWYRP